MNANDARAAGRREWIGLAVLALPALLVTMDLSVLFLALPALTRDLDPTSAELLWITDVYGFLVAGSLITMGTLGDRIGRRRLLMLGGAGFAAASLLAALSTGPEMLIAARALLGVAGATLAPSALALVRDLFPDERQRSTAVGIFVSCFAAGAAVGPLVGGALLELFWWGSVFLINLPAMALLLVLAPRLLPESRDPDGGRFNLPSALLSLAAMLLLVYGMKELAVHGAGGVALATLAAGLALGAVFLRRELRSAARLIDLHLFRLPAFSASIVAMVLATGAMAGILLFVAQYLQLVRGMGTLEAGLWSVPAMLGTIAGSMLAPAVAARLSAASVVPGALAIAALGLLAIAASGEGAALAPVIGGSVVMGLGAGAIGTVGTDVVLGSAPPQRAGGASALSETAAELGGALGIAVLGSIGTAAYRADVDAALGEGVGGGAGAAARDSLASASEAAAGLPPALLETATAAFVDGFQLAALCAALALAAGAALAHLALARRGAAGPELSPAADPAGR